MATRALAAPAKSDGERLTELLDQLMQEALTNSPQLMTFTGMDTGANAGAKRRLDDRSAAGLALTRELFEKMKRHLAEFEPDKLRGMDLVNHRSAEYLTQTTLQSFTFGYGDPGAGGAVPYIVSQLSGNYRNIPSFLGSQHSVGNTADAEAYLERLAAFGVTLDQETVRLKEDFGRGVVPPDFILRSTLTQLDGMYVPAPSRSELVANLLTRTASKHIAGDWEARATKLVADSVYPAMRRQADALRAALPKATADAGVWHLPRGDEYYRFAVRSFTTSDMSGEEIHALGLELVRKLTGEAQAIVEARGLKEGTVAQRVATLRKEQSQLYPNDDSGRAQILADMRKMVDAIAARLPAYFGALPRAPVEILRVPESIQSGSPGGYYTPPTVGGARPGMFYINLRDVHEWPKFDVPTLVYHEVSPGHHLQNALATEATGIPLMRKLPLFSGYSEGWALYSEQLADEMGMYQGDPLGRLGYLMSLLFRATRLVVDSGLHHKRWTREQAIRYMVDTLGDKESSVTREVERYCVQPGQASSYMLGHQVWTRSRAAARARLGTRFDLKRFHDAGLTSGTMPLTVLEQLFADWTVS